MHVPVFWCDEESPFYTIKFRSEFGHSFRGWNHVRNGAAICLVLPTVRSVSPVGCGCHCQLAMDARITECRHSILCAPKATPRRRRRQTLERSSSRPCYRLYSLYVPTPLPGTSPDGQLRTRCWDARIITCGVALVSTVVCARVRARATCCRPAC
jgi:hypothetical protein